MGGGVAKPGPMEHKVMRDYQKETTMNEMTRLVSCGVFVFCLYTLFSQWPNVPWYGWPVTAVMLWLASYSHRPAGHRQ